MTTAATNLEGLMRRIAGLIAKADSTDFPEEAKALRAKAEELLRKYRIEESDLISEGVSAVEPVSRKVNVSASGQEFLNEHYWIWHAIARHCGLRSYENWERTSGRLGYVATAVGYDVDIRLAELLFASATLVFGQCLEPDVNANETDAENIYRLRSAGIDRQTIAERVFGKKGHAEGLKVGSIYRAECERRGESAAVAGRTINAKTYRKAYAKQFVTAFERRLREARDAADSVGGVVVLVGRAEKVNEAFYKLFPEMRPKPKSEETVQVSTAKPTKTRELTKAQMERIHREYYGPAARAAGKAAVAAAGKVRLDRTTPADRLAEPARDDTKEISG